MTATFFAMLFVHVMMFRFCDGKKFTVSASVSADGKNAVAMCGPIYTTEGLGYRARDGETIHIPVDGDSCYKCGPCTYRTGMVCTRNQGECPSPSRPSERLEQRLGHGRSIISIDESKPYDEVYTGVLDPKTRPNEYKVEPVPPIASMDPEYFRKLTAEQGSGDGSGGSGGSGEGSGSKKTREGSG